MGVHLQGAAEIEYPFAENISRDDSRVERRSGTNHSVGLKTQCLTNPSQFTGVDEWEPKAIRGPNDVDVDVDVRVCSHVRIASMNSEE